MHIHKEAFMKIGLHILLWVFMILYFVFAPEIFTLAFNQNGKPVQVNASIPAESDRIHFVIEDLAPYVKDGENLYELIGWSFIVPDEGISPEVFIREIVLVSDERNYFFSVRSGRRKPDIPSRFNNIDIDLDSLGLSMLVADDMIKPGKYRIGIVFRNTSDGSAFYWDKPIYYLVKTPNTVRLERK
jgi:hypothetical protein